MGEGEKFIRQIIPGFLFVFCLTIQLYFIPDIRIIETIQNLDTSSAIVLIFSSGMIGYIFSTIYFVFCELIGINITHKEFIKTLIAEKIILVKDKTEKEISSEDVDKFSWSIINVIWFSILDQTKFVSINTPVQRLSNILHGIGISVVAVFFSLLISTGFLFSVESTSCSECTSFTSYLFAFIFITIFLSILIVNYIFTRRNYLKFVNTVALNELKIKGRSEFITIYYSE